MISVVPKFSVICLSPTIRLQYKRHTSRFSIHLLFAISFLVPPLLVSQSISAASANGLPVSFVGNALVPRDENGPDLDNGNIFIMDANLFNQAGKLISFSYVSGDNLLGSSEGNLLTPLILAPIQGGYIITGIGDTLTNPGTADIHTFDFEVVEGSDSVLPGYAFGWRHGGTSGSGNVGSIDFTQFAIGGGKNDIPGSGLAIAVIGDTGFSLGDELTDLEYWKREYAFQANQTLVPLPAGIWLFGSGLLGLIGMARREKVA